MNDEQRLLLERLFDGEPVDDPRALADDADARAYLRQLALLRELSLRHDPAATQSRRCPMAFPPRRRGRTFAKRMALAASLLLMALLARHVRRTDREPASTPPAPAKSSVSAAVASVATIRPQSHRTPMEVRIYRWANAASPGREDAARIVLSRVEPLHGRPASHEVLALELANSTAGSVPRLLRSVSSHATSTPGSSRRPVPSNRPRPLSPPRA